uniref:Acid-sensing ion channel 1 n=1 Tax=Strongyloides venezuelensis TaxID=75913 RepID=A0A0K0FCF3_STRVS
MKIFARFSKNNKKKKDDNPSIKGPSLSKRIFFMFHDFSQWSTLSGFNHIFGTKNIFIILFWILVTGICVFFSFIQTKELLDAYFEYPYSTDILLKYEKVTFPAVTICSRSPYVDNKKNKYLTEIVNAFKRRKDKNWGLHGFNDGINLSHRETIKFWLSIYGDELLNDDNINHYWKDSILSCHYNQDRCEDVNVKLVKIPTYGTCFTLNHLGTWKVARSGDEYGLKLVLRLDKTVALPFDVSYGVTAFVHSYDEYPFVETNPILLSFGLDVSLGLSFSSSERLPKPHGTCIPNDSNKLEDTDNFYGGMYQNEKCIRSCIQRKIVENCNCYYEGYAINDQYPNTKSCSMYIEEDEKRRPGTLACIENHIFPDIKKYVYISINDIMFHSSDEMAYIVNITSDCVCYDTCDKIFYDYSYSLATYPAPNFIPNECRKFVLENKKYNNITLPYDYTKTECIKYYSKNTLRLEVYFEKLSYIVSSEFAEYPTINLLYDVVGILGFWIGISLISFFEIFVFIVVIMFSLCFLCKNPIKSIKVREVRKNIRDGWKDDIDKNKKLPRRKDLYDKAAEADKMPPIHESN